MQEKYHGEIGARIMNHPAFQQGRLAQAQALVSQMTLAEKADFCSGQDFWHLADLSRLGIDKIMVTDGPHGLRKQAKDMDHLGAHRSVPATCFPTASALASSWDTALIQRVGEALGQTCVDEDVSVLLGPGLNIKAQSAVRAQLFRVLFGRPVS